MTEFRLFDTPGAEVATIVTDGSTFKPFLNAVGRVADEVRMHVSPDGLAVTVVDAANVFMGDIELGADAFDTFDVAEEQVLGVNIGDLQSLTRRARKGTTDELTLSVRERELTASVSRGYENHNVVSQGTVDLIDPDSIRGEPDIPDLDLDVSVTVDLPPFTDALSYAVGASDHVEISVKGVNQHANALYLGGETDTREEAAAIDGIDTDATAEALYSADYVASILGGITDIGGEAVTLAFNSEFPAFFRAEREEIPLRAEYAVAPRVTSDD